MPEGTATPAPEGGSTEKPSPVGETAKPVGLDWTTIKIEEVPEDVVKQHPLFKKVLTESIQRKEKIADLRKQLEPDEAKPAPVPTAPVVGDDPVMVRLMAMEAKLAKQEKDAARMTVALKYKLPVGLDEGEKNVIPFILGDTAEEMEESAKNIAALIKPEQPGSSTSPAHSGGFNSLDSMKARIAEKIKGGTEATSPFDAGVMRQQGGGVLVNTKQGN